MSEENAPLGADRRGFLLRASTLGVAAVGVAAAGPSLASTGAPARTADLAGAAEATGPLMAYVKDAARGQIAVLIGEREVVYTDRAAVAAIYSAAGR